MAIRSRYLLSKQSIQFYDFSAGVNYRDNIIPVNGLRDVKNLYWNGDRLTRRLGYEVRNNTLDPTTIISGSAVVKIIDHLYYKWGSSEYYFIFAGVDSSGGSTIDRLMIFYYNGLPSSAVTFTPLASGYEINWTENDPFSITQLGDKIYIALGDDDPYVLYYDSSWKTRELPVCATMNDGSTDGANIIQNGTDDDWGGAKWVASYDHFLYLSDEKMTYFAIRDEVSDPAKGVTETDLQDFISGVQQSWDATWVFAMPINDKLDKAIPFKNYLFMYGETSIWHFMNRFSDANPIDYDKQRVSDVGVYGELLITPSTAFWVGKDNIYGFDGVTITPLAKKIWNYIESQHNSIPNDLSDCSLVWYKNKVWISFPNSTNKEIYVFDPDYTYADSAGDYHIPFYRFLYHKTNSSTSIGFKKLKNFDSKLFGISGTYLYQLDTGYFDDNGNDNVPIVIEIKFAYFDFDVPSFKKTFGRIIFETDANIDDILELSLTFKRDYGEESSSAVVLDTTYTGNQRSYIELQAPYNIDGNSISLELTSDGTGRTGTGNINIYGFSIEYAPKKTAKKED